MPGKNHEEFEKAQKDGKGMKSKFQAARDAMYQKRLKDMGVSKKGVQRHGYKYTDATEPRNPYYGVASDAGTIGRSSTRFCD